MGSGMVIGGRVEAIPGVDVENWFDVPAYRLGIGAGLDGTTRRVEDPQLVVVHSTKGIPGGRNAKPQRFQPGAGPRGNAAEATIRYWTLSPTQAGAHILIDFDGQVICTADLRDETTYHAGGVNDRSIGIEVVQGEASDHAYFYEIQRTRTVQVLDWLTRRFRIQRQFPRGFTTGGWVTRLRTDGGASCRGVCQHRDQTPDRGRGDCGDWLVEDLTTAGYEGTNWRLDEDLHLWRPRQEALNTRGAGLVVDGQPGRKTADALERLMGKKHGLWVARPGD